MYTKQFDKVALTPWAVGRESVRDYLNRTQSHMRLPYEMSESVQSVYKKSLVEIGNAPDLFAENITPVADDLKGIDDIAGLTVDLIRDFVDNPVRSKLIQLYQVFFSDWLMPFNMWSKLSSLLKESDIVEREDVYQLFLWWVVEAPDTNPVDFALFMLARTKYQPPLDLLIDFGVSHKFVPGVSSVISMHYEDSEEPLIFLAKHHTGSARQSILRFLKSVEQPENRQWLLAEGYDSQFDYEPCAYEAVIHGHLIERLRGETVLLNDLLHYARALEILCDAAGGSSSWYTINDYKEGPEAVDLLIKHVRSHSVPEKLWRSLARVLHFLVDGWKGYDDEESQYWPDDVCKELAIELRALLTLPHIPEEVRLKLLYWEQPEPTISDLESGDLSVFHDVLESAVSEEDLTGVINWAIDYLQLNGDIKTRKARREELNNQTMPGICLGGLAGLTERDLSSVFGQIILQILLKLKKGPVKPGWPILKQGLNSDQTLLRSIAVEALSQWPDEALLTQDVRENVLSVAARYPDETTNVALLKRLIRLFLHSDDPGLIDIGNLLAEKHGVEREDPDI